MQSTEKGNRPLATITGASSGIGYELAKQFAKNGFDLLVVAEDAGLAEAAQVFRTLGTEVHTLQVNLAERQGVELLYTKIKSLPQPLDTIAINAGVGVGGASFDKTELEDELNLINLNVTSTVHLTKLILPDMLAAGHGRILFTSSVAAFMPGPYEAVYSASKAFVQSFAEALHFETKDKGITVTSLQPGPTDTKFFHRAGMDDTKVGRAKKDHPAKVAKQGFEALMKGEHAIVAGSLKNKIEANAARLSPQQVGAKFHETLSRPNSAKNR
jgi:short-subunit dehydrogenase